MECGDILLEDPRLRSILHHLVVKNVFYLWHRPEKILGDLVECNILITKHFPPSPFGTTMMAADQLDLLPHITFAVRSLLISSLTHLWCFIAIGYGFCETGLEFLVSIIILVSGVVPMVVSSCAN